MSVPNTAWIVDYSQSYKESRKTRTNGHKDSRLAVSETQSCVVNRFTKKGTAVREPTHFLP